MLLVLPISHVDACMAFDITRMLHVLHEDTGGPACKQHELLIVASPRARNAAWGIWEELRCSSLFSSAVLHNLEEDNFTGWPQATNYMFWNAAKYVHEQWQLPRYEPWYFMEADSIPLKATWLDELETEYQEAGRRFMGYVHCSRVRIDGSNVNTSEGPLHMNGSGLYPGDVFTSQAMRHLLLNPMPWDIFMADEILSDCHETRKIQLNWSTMNYQRVDGQIICDPMANSYPVYAKPVSPEAAVLHGCKDGSLLRALTTHAAWVNAQSFKIN